MFPRMNAVAVMNSGYVTRWHNNPDMAHHPENLAEHQGRVAQLLLAFHPQPALSLIAEALLHDVGELVAGDLNADFKRDNPEFAEEHREFEYAARIKMGAQPVPLDEENRAWVKWADQASSIDYVSRKETWLLTRDDWRRAIQHCRDFIFNHNREAHGRFETLAESWADRIRIRHSVGY